VSTTVTSGTTVTEVTRINRPGVGYVYRAVITLATLYKLLARSVVRYSPKYQRGTGPKIVDPDEEMLSRLYPIESPEIAIERERTYAMAVKFLMGVNDAGKLLFNWEVIWNARADELGAAVAYDSENRTLEIDTDITIPDSGHRHAAYYELVRWKMYPQTVPAQVVVDGELVHDNQIRGWLDAFKPEDHEVYVVIFNVDPEDEGRLYDELNADQRKPPPGKQITLNMEKDPVRRVLRDILDRDGVLNRDEIELQKGTIIKASRKLVTVNTLYQAFQPFMTFLGGLESKPKARKDFLEFIDAFFGEWASHVAEFKRTASASQRHELRSKSLGISNIMMFPLVRIAVESWRECSKKEVDWRNATEWRQTLAKIAGKTTETYRVDDPSDPDHGKSKQWTGEVMSTSNPAWRGGIMIKKTNTQGDTKWIVSSTRDTRQFAYTYLAQIGNHKIT
jgi:DNA-sulfur modification-associated